MIETSSAQSPVKRQGVVLVTVDEGRQGQRIDNFLVGQFKAVPKSRLYRIIRKGEVRVNKKRVKPEYKLQAGDVVRIPPINVEEKQTAVVNVSNSLRSLLQHSILFENDELMVVNKPAGIAVHGGSGIQLGLIEALRDIFPDYRFLELVHRLDRDTSGCIMIAKKRSMLRYLHACLRLENDGKKQIQKTYHALVHGKWPSHHKLVDLPLLRYELKSGERMVKVAQDGKPSLTKFKVLSRPENVSDFTLLEAQPVTGRTHQIRVHTAFSGCPIVGDTKYSDDVQRERLKNLPSKRLMLHAAKLRFHLPESQKYLVVEAPYPKDFQEVLDFVGAN
jgi:23S rRNA pseudouridine955/2504/2580 synthase